MLIVSKFHDYYDTAMGYGIDKECVYKRETIDKEIKLNCDLLVPKIIRENCFYECVLGFCGKIYPFIFSDYKVWVKNPRRLIFYKKEELIEFLESIDHNFKEWSWNRHYTKVGIGEFYSLNHSPFMSIFHEYKTPVFYIRKDYSKTYLTINPKLKSLKFQRLKDPYTTFQEIYMYLSGVLGNTGENISEVPDKYKIKQHGFYEYSFKKLPTKK